MEDSKRVSYIVLTIIIVLLVLIILFLKKGEVSDENEVLLPDGSVVVTNDDYDGTHLGMDLNDILNEDYYNEVGINPENYETFEDFLDDFATFENVPIDPINEKFVIGINGENGRVSYLPFDFKNDIPNKLDTKETKNLAILDIYSAYKDDNIYGGKDSEHGNKILFEDDLWHPQTEELYKVFNFEVNVNDYINELAGIDNISGERNELLSYMYELVGDYEKAEENREKQCSIDETCEERYIDLTVVGTVKDSSGNVVEGVKIELLNDPSIFTYSKADGTYEYTVRVNRFSHLRFKSSKSGYSNGFGTVSYNMSDFPKDTDVTWVDFHVYSPNEMVTISDDNYESFVVGNYYLVEVDYSKYYIPIDGLYYEDETPYTDHNFYVYTYQFTKWTDMSSLLENDTFDAVYGYVGNIMKTFGMPYIQFFDINSGRELFIKSSNPMILQNQVYHMKELYEDYDQLYGPITEEDMEFLYNYSEEQGGYPIDFDFLTENDFLRWPARWSLDRKAGVWENVGQRLLSTGGLVELPFYSIRDN